MAEKTEEGPDPERHNGGRVIVGGEDNLWIFAASQEQAALEQVADGEAGCFKAASSQFLFEFVQEQFFVLACYPFWKAGSPGFVPLGNLVG